MAAKPRNGATESESHVVQGPHHVAHAYEPELSHRFFGTKGRAQSIGPDMRDDVSRYLGGIIKSENGLPLEIGAVADHVHLLVRLPPTVALADLLRTLKANSSKWLNDTRFPRRTFAWQDGYAAFTVSQSQLGRVATYVRNQAEHHRRMTFREELIALFERNGVKYDERYLPR